MKVSKPCIYCKNIRCKVNLHNLLIPILSLLGDFVYNTIFAYQLKFKHDVHFWLSTQLLILNINKYMDRSAS